MRKVRFKLKIGDDFFVPRKKVNNYHLFAKYLIKVHLRANGLDFDVLKDSFIYLKKMKAIYNTSNFETTINLCAKMIVYDDSIFVNNRLINNRFKKYLTFIVEKHFINAYNSFKDDIE